MVAFRIGDITLATVDDGAFGTVLEAAAIEGGPDAFPVLYSLLGSSEPIDPMSLMDELACLSATPSGQMTAGLLGTLRDDLMAAVAAADEG